ncbi:MAG: methylated-DNA--[protein]-cysteine S-methyltransferase [Bryobacteraceae bacterium]|jgi:methylated-DNA-[protein]-cysteine S-methyltransferase
MDLFVDRVTSPIGALRLLWSGTAGQIALRMLHLPGDDGLARAVERHYGPCHLIPSPAPPEIRDPLEAYFAGRIAAIDSIPVEAAGTPFQLEVWAALRRIPAGSTTSYGQLAARIGRPNASRAVGLANGSNPVAIVVPCHRVIGANGALTGYGGGLARKRWLLDHERGGALPFTEEKSV